MKEAMDEKKCSLFTSSAAKIEVEKKPLCNLYPKNRIVAKNVGKDKKRTFMILKSRENAERFCRR